VAGVLLGLLLAAPSAIGAESETQSSGSPAAPSTTPDLLIVEWANAASHADRVAARAEADVAFESDLGDRSFQLVSVQPGQSAAEAVAELAANPVVVVVEPDSYSVPNSVPNDPLFAQHQLWGLQNPGTGIDGALAAVPGADIDAAAAWDRTVGSPSVAIADIDSGYRFDAPDLAPVAWSNSDEVDGNSIDDDANGFVDDRRGYDFVGSGVSSGGSPQGSDNDPTDDNIVSGGHGVHTAGTMGAAGNDGIGITGVAQNVRIMPLRVCANSVSAENEARCPVSSQIAAINYAGANGARVANMSLGGTGSSQAEVNAFAANPQTLFVISAGNDSADNEEEPHYPCGYQPQTEAFPPVIGAIDNILCVAATDQADDLASFSDWGSESVDLGAPGTETLSTYPLIETEFEDDFQSNDFGSAWSSTGAGFGRAGSGDGPLTSFGMTDSPGAAPAPGSAHQVVTATGIAVPAGSGSCTLSGLRFRRADPGSSSFFYQVLSDGSSAFINMSKTDTSGSAMAHFNTIPITGLGGHSVTVKFGYTAGPAPTAGSGIWLDDLKLTCYAPLATPPGYEFLQGTSMAAPHVTGAAGLLFSLKPSATVTEIRSALLSSVTPTVSLTGKIVSGGRLNLPGAMYALVQPGGTQPPDTEIVSGPPNPSLTLNAEFSFGRVGGGTATFECRLVGETGWEACSSPAGYSVGPGKHAFEVRAVVAGLTDPIPASQSWTAEKAVVVGPGEVIVAPFGGSLPAGPMPAAALASPTAPSCKVPKLTGKTLGQAKAALRAAGCSLGKVSAPKSKKGQKAPALVVKSSSPAPGSGASGAVSLTLGPKPKKHRH